VCGAGQELVSLLNFNTAAADCWVYDEFPITGQNRLQRWSVSKGADTEHCPNQGSNSPGRVWQTTDTPREKLCIIISTAPNFRFNVHNSFSTRGKWPKSFIDIVSNLYILYIRSSSFSCYLSWHIACHCYGIYTISRSVLFRIGNFVASIYLYKPTTRLLLYSCVYSTLCCWCVYNILPTYRREQQSIFSYIFYIFSEDVTATTWSIGQLALCLLSLVCVQTAFFQRIINSQNT
jgi:hypothetical protein